MTTGATPGVVCNLALMSRTKSSAVRLVLMGSSICVGARQTGISAILGVTLTLNAVVEATGSARCHHRPCRGAFSPRRRCRCRAQNIAESFSWPLAGGFPGKWALSLDAVLTIR